MKKSFIFLSALLTLFACSKDDSTGGDDSDDQVKYSTSTPEHFSFQLGYDDAESANFVETNEYTAIAFIETLKYNLGFIPEGVKKPDNSKLLYSYDTEEYYKVFDTKHYYTITHSYYAYYSAIVEWDDYAEYKEYNGITEGRSVQKNIKCTVKYVGCTTGTPSQYVPVATPPEVTTYPACEGEWILITSGSGSGGSSSGGSSGGTISTDEYSYYCKTTCYKTNGESDDLYIYKKGSDYRASFSNEYTSLDKSATLAIITGSATIDGTNYSYYVQPFGICFYFNFKK